MRVWRICKQRHVATAFSGEGARLFAARWNSVGTPLVYTSLSLSLAVVEVFVHIKKGQAPDDLMSIEASLPVDETRIEEEKSMMLSRLPPDWRREGHPVLQKIGDEWVASKRSLALPVPSVVVDGEWNVLVNPEHPDAARIKVDTAKPFHFDTRMFQGRL